MKSAPCHCLTPLPELPPVAVRSVRAYAQLSREAMTALCGAGSELPLRNELPQTPWYVSNVTIELLGPHGTVAGIHVIGPIAATTEIVLSPSEAHRAGLTPPVRLPGDQDETSGGRLRGPTGEYAIDGGILVMRPHIVLSPALAARANLQAGCDVAAWIAGTAPLVLPQVPIVIAESRSPELLIDADLAQRIGCPIGTRATLLPALTTPEASLEAGAVAGVPLITEEDIVRAHVFGRSLRASSTTIITPAAQEADRRYHVIRTAPDPG